MKAYMLPYSRTFHRTPDCHRTTRSPYAELEVEDRAMTFPITGRTLTRCQRCWPEQTFRHDTISLATAAARMGISSWQGKRLAQDGKFPGAFRLAERSWWRVSVPALEQFLKEPISG